MESIFCSEYRTLFYLPKRCTVGSLASDKNGGISENEKRRLLVGWAKAWGVGMVHVRPVQNSLHFHRSCGFDKRGCTCIVSMYTSSYINYQNQCCYSMKCTFNFPQRWVVEWPFIFYVVSEMELHVKRCQDFVGCKRATTNQNQVSQGFASTSLLRHNVKCFGTIVDKLRLPNLLSAGIFTMRILTCPKTAKQNVTRAKEKGSIYM